MLIRSDCVVNSDPIKFGLVDVLGAQVGQVGQIGELGHGHEGYSYLEM